MCILRFFTFLSLLTCLLASSSVIGQEIDQDEFCEDYGGNEVIIDEDLFNNPEFRYGVVHKRPYTFEKIKIDKFILIFNEGGNIGGPFRPNKEDRKQFIINPGDVSMENLNMAVVDMVFWGIAPPTSSKSLIMVAPSDPKPNLAFTDVVIDILIQSEYLKDEAKKGKIQDLFIIPFVFRDGITRFVLWNRADKYGEPPSFLFDEDIVKAQCEPIPLELGDTKKTEILYVDISDCANKKGLITELKGKIKEIESDKNKFYLYLSNGTNPYTTKERKESKKILKRMRILEPDPPSPGTDIKMLQEFLDDNRAIKPGGEIVFHFYLSESYYDTNLVNGEVLFIENLLEKYKEKTDNIKVFIHLEDLTVGKGEFKPQTYKLK